MADTPSEQMLLTDAEILGFGPGQEDAPWPYEAQLYFARAVERALLAKLREQQQPVAWVYRHVNESEAMTDWAPVKPRDYLQTLEQRVSELQCYRYEGSPCYEVRPLYAAPVPTTAAPAEEREALAVVAAMGSGWSFEGFEPSPYLTDEANDAYRFQVKRSRPPFCAERRQATRAWSGRTPYEALANSCADLGLPIPAPTPAAQAAQAVPDSWTHVHDALPAAGEDKDIPVWTWDGTTVCEDTYGPTYEQPAGPAVGGWVCTGFAFLADIDGRVTHWMPRHKPAAPTPTGAGDSDAA